ncbi:MULTISPECIES: energy transducer TonB [Bacteroidales]|jgi:tonB family C-terminal domain|uniref:Cell envelope biogenesis protein TonB n=1 Tax=Coprobacter secundus subsp. similis TaxID=2751153 RepID=A0A7G1HUK7_9BACT|nr:MULTISPECIES: energy transducer TonB [Bacteroidales]KHM48682.1 energy transducer TonB [Coprobacter secundus]BCI63435.1 cell envelope biogenesis protein TonB [Coprobacter secundus subsp. similis]CCY36431.1 tonB family domain-containing protein [Tannerella sp. CAG:118]
MAKIDLTSREWCDLVFEGRNKAYGAFELRQSSPKRHNIAMIIIIVVAVIAFSVPALIRFVTPEKVEEAMTEVTTLSKLPEAEVKKNEDLKPLAPETPPPPPLKSSIKFTAPVIKKDEEVSEEDEIKSQDELAKNDKVAISIADVKGNDEINGADIADFKEVVRPEAPKEEKEVPYQAVEQMPQFPGGDAELMKYIQDHLKYPVIAAENGIQGRVIVRFVVSKTGEIQDVTVLRGVDSSLDKEAVRVIKSMPKWIPGKQNGNNVAVYFTVPVMFKLM